MLSLLLAAAAASAFAPMDFPSLDRAIEQCERGAVAPIFAAEAERRSAFWTAAYEEQAAISSERGGVIEKRRLLREAPRAAGAKAEPPKAGESDQELALAQLALDDRQRVLDDRRRLETMRQQAVELKRQYFLTRCPSGKKKGS
jgi:hypothetical protein